MGIKNGFPSLRDDNYVWTCPGCNVTYINADYCYRCDKLNEEDNESTDKNA